MKLGFWSLYCYCTWEHYHKIDNQSSDTCIDIYQNIFSISVPMNESEQREECKLLLD